ncbi:MAG: Mur ligase family protein, partial [Xanthobacteraceae bacterium]
MTPITIFRGRTVAVFGLGSSGLATCAALTAGGATIVAFDDKPNKVAEAEDKGVTTGDLREIDWKNIATLVLAPGVPLTHPAPHWTVQLARRAEVEVIGDIELFCRERRARAPKSPFAAITGTNGKSTTTALLAHILARNGRDVAVGGNLGTPILSLAAPSQARVHVIECSSFQIDLAPTLDPSVGVLLNVTPDHIDRHGAFRNYAAIKEQLITGIGYNGTAVIGV